MLGGCSDDPSGPSTSSVIMPLAVGNTYIYNTDWEGNSYTDSCIIGSIKVVNGDIIYLRANFDHKDGYFHRGDSLFAYFDSTILFIATNPNYIGELISNDTDIVAETDAQGNPTGYSYTTTHRRTVSAIDTLITVPAGTFHCFGYKIESNILHRVSPVHTISYYYYSQKVGNVLHKNYEVISDTLKLTSSGQLIHVELH